MIKKPHRHITDSAFSMISEKDRKTIEAFNRTDAPVPDCLLHEFFEAQAGIRPDKTAVISGDKRLTYKELDALANIVARHLLSLNMATGDIVGICLDRSVEMVVSVLGILKAGGCYLPLDPSFPDERIHFMLEDSEAKILISQNSIRNKFNLFPGVFIVIIDNNFLSFEKIYSKPDLNLTPQSFAYILYTSGSTGKPKGVRIHHQAVVNFINSMIHEPGVTENDTLLAVTTLSFDISVLEIFLPLSVGATVVVAVDGEIINGTSLIDLLENQGITFLQATPSLWNFLVASGWKGNRNIRGICGGEALSPSLVRQILPKIGELWNFYGPTETTVWSTGTKISDCDAPVLIGKPICNTRIYILGHNNKLVPVGETGEICIGGLGVAKGYFKNDEFTAQKFIQFEDSGIIYKTGDLGRFYGDGNIEFLGRIDNQIKFRGYRIEPGEIETALTAIKGVREAVVRLHKFDENDERILAYLNVPDDFNLSEKEIIYTLALSLPQYSIPRFFQRSDGFPRMPNKKINKKSPFFDTWVTDKKAKSIELLPTEELIYNIWCETLKTKNISITDNFFEIGGNSLLALSVFSKITSAFKVEMGLRIFFDSPRIRDLAELIDFEIQNTVKVDSSDKIAHSKSKLLQGEI